jgi:FUN14 family
MPSISDPSSSDGVIKKYYEEIRKSSSGTQITVGALSGWCAGFVFTKFGKTAATAIGGSLLLLHVSLLVFIHVSLTLFFITTVRSSSWIHQG